MNRVQRRAAAKFLATESAKWPCRMVPVPKDQWPTKPSHLMAVFRSNQFLAQLFVEDGDQLRLSINRTQLDGSGGWREGISWDDLQQIKDQCGYGGYWALEVFPPNAEVVNVANMRHLWIVKVPPDFAWRKTL